MSETVLTIIELDNYPEDVVARATWLAKLMDCDLELLLCDPTTSFLSEVFIISSEVRDLADDIEEAQKQALRDLAKTPSHRGCELPLTSVTSDPLPMPSSPGRWISIRCSS
jgi:hypothetical protein